MMLAADTCASSERIAVRAFAPMETSAGRTGGR